MCSRDLWHHFTIGGLKVVVNLGRVVTAVIRWLLSVGRKLSW